MKELSENKKITINMLMMITNFIITICISLFVTPYIVDQLGSEAYGFVGLANNFVSYASLITIAINSMASRFISIELFKKNYKEASKYFSSVFFANLAIAIVLTPILFFTVIQLHNFLDIPSSLALDVKIAFSIVFIQFIANILLSRFEIAPFVTNNLYLEQRNTMISSFLRLIIILGCFTLFTTRISFLTLGSLVGTLFVYGMNCYYTKKFLPELVVKKSYFDIQYIKKLLSSGVWNLINKLSAILLDGLDLLIANLLIGAGPMGALSISKTIPAMFLSLRGTLDYPFTPPMTKCYAHGDIDGVIKYARLGNKILGIFMIAPMATFAVFGQDFFKLWVPKEDSYLIQILSLLAIMSLLAGACINSVFTVFTICNKVKIPSLVVLATGIATTLTNFVLLNTTNWGVYIIAGVSSLFSLLRNYIFTPLYGAYCLGVKRSTFYHEIITGNICLVINIAGGFLIRRYISVNSWVEFIAVCAVTVIVCISINSCIVLNKYEIKWIYSIAKRRIAKK